MSLSVPRNRRIKTTTTFRVAAVDLHRLEQLARLEGKSRSELIREALVLLFAEARRENRLTDVTAV